MNCTKSVRLRLAAAGIASAVSLAGCFSDDGSEGAAFSSGGTAAKGAVTGATCQAVGASGTLIGAPVPTNPDGTFTISGLMFPGDYPVEFTCTGGTYFDEATNQAKALPAEGFSVVIPSQDDVNAAGGNVAVTPFTTLAAELYKKSPVKTPNAAKAALNQIIGALAPGLSDGSANAGSALLRAPTPVTSNGTALANNTAGKYATYLAGLSQLAADNPSLGDTTDVINSLRNAIKSSASTTVSFDTAISSNLVASAAKYVKDTNTGTPAADKQALEADVADDNTGTGQAEVPEDDTPPTPPATGSTGGTGGTAGNGGGG